MLNEAIGSILPAAVAVALSPIPIVAVIVMLGTPRARRNGPAFAIGWIAGLSVVMAVVLVALGGAANKSTKDTSVQWGTLALGIVLFVLAARQWRKRPRDGETPEMPDWVSQVDSFGAGRALVSGLALSGLNPKNLALTVAAAGAIASAELAVPDEVRAAAFFVAIASSSVIGLVLVALIAPRATSRPLTAVREYMGAHSAVIMTVILVLIGAKLVGDAIGG